MKVPCVCRGSVGNVCDVNRAAMAICPEALSDYPTTHC